MTDYNIRQAYEQYSKESQQWRDSLRQSFAFYGCIDNDIQRALEKLLDLLEFKDVIPVSQMTNRTQVYACGTVLPNTLRKSSPIWRRLIVILHGLWDGHDLEGHNLVGPQHRVIVDETFNRAGNNVTIPGDKLRVDLPTWKVLKAMQEARDKGIRLSLSQLRQITPKARDLLVKFNERTASPHHLPLIDMPNGKKGRGYALE